MGKFFYYDKEEIIIFQDILGLMQVTPVSSGLSIGSTNWVLETDFHKVRLLFLFLLMIVSKKTKVQIIAFAKLNYFPMDCHVFFFLCIMLIIVC